MRFTLRRTVASELTLWLSMITAMIAVVIGLSYYLYSSHSVTRELMTEAERTAEELSQVFVAPLYNFDKVTVQTITNIYLSSDRVSGMAIRAEGMGEIFNNLASVSSSLPLIAKNIGRDDLLLGSMELVFNDRPVLEARKRAIWTTLVSVTLLLLLYIISLHLILRRILVEPLTGVGERLLEIADGSFAGRMDLVPQEDLNTIVIAANKMSEEIATRTRILEENERNYREVYNATSDAIFIHDAEDGSIVDINQTMLDMYGYSRREAMALQVGDLSSGEAPYSQQQAGIMVRKALQEGPQVFKWQAKRKDGSLFWGEIALKKTVIGGEEVVLATVRDISERQQLEDKLRHAQKMEAIGTLAGGIAHDFNNILTAILGYTELALTKSDTKSALFNDLQQIEKASKRARDLVRQILTFSRKQHQKKEVLPLVSVVDEAVTFLRSSIPVTVEIKQDFSSQAKVEVDPGQMHQVIINLCTNGYQSMPDASGTLFISVQDMDIEESDSPGSLELDPGRYVVLEVRDNGAGMDESTISNIFEPYFTTKDSDKGTGLGLAVVHGIVTSHQGRITVDSEPGRGTTFRVYLPVTDGKEVAEDKPPASEPAPEGNQKVMVVDDEESIRNLLDQMLSHAGYRVDVFADGVAAWNALSADPMAWDLMITDLTMPKMNGAELTRKVVQLRPEMPIILCTGFNEMDSGEDLPVSSCLQKPVTMQELFATTARVLQGRAVD